MKCNCTKSVFVLSLIFLVFIHAVSARAPGAEPAKRSGTKSAAAKKNAEKRGKKTSRSRNDADAARKSNPNKIAPHAETAGKSEKTLSSAAIGNRFLLNKPVAEFTEADKRKIRRELEILRRRKTTQQFLSIIRLAEAGEPNIMVGDKPGCRVASLKKHPGEVLPKRCFYYFYDKKGKLQFSTASGNYQITRQNFRIFAPFLNLRDFEVSSQQLAALELVRRGGRKPKQVKKGFEALVRGNVREAVRLGTPDWASIPGSDLPGKKRTDFEQIVRKVLRNPAAETKPVNNKKIKNHKAAANSRSVVKINRRL